MTTYDTVLLIGFGGPTKMDDVRPFLANVLRGRPAPPERIESVVHHYELIGGKSPFNELTMRQARALAAELAATGTPLPVYVGMRNWHPYLKDTLAEMSAAGVRKVLALIMAPQQNEAGWYRYQQDAEQARQALGSSAPHIDYAEEWHADPLFIEAMRDNVQVALAALANLQQHQAAPTSAAKPTRLIFTAHSIPVSMAEKSPYVEQLTEAAEQIAAAVEQEHWLLAYQSRSGNPRDPWLGPDICELLRSLAADGIGAVTLAPIGFVCDHVEVLYDLDIEAKQVADELGLSFSRAATVNDHPAFIRMLAEVVRRSHVDA